MTAAIASPLGAFTSAARPAQIRTLRAFVEAEIELPDGPRKGDKFDGEFPSWQGELLEMEEGDEFNEFWKTGSRQSGKTLLGFEAPLLYHLFEMHEDVICLVPEMSKARTIWLKKIQPVIERSRYAHLLPKTGRGSRGGGDVDLIIFENGVSMHFMGAGGADPPSSATARVVAITEANEMRISPTGDQGNPINAVKGCTASFGESARIFGESIITNDQCITWKQITEVGTDTRPHLRCPHCGTYQFPERERLVGWQEAVDAVEAAEKARYACVGCAGLWTAKDRDRAIAEARLLHRGEELDAKGKKTGERPRTRCLGARWNAMCHPLRTMADIAEKEWNARRLGTDAEEMAICQYTWAIPYVPRAQISLRPLAIAKLSKASGYGIGDMPSPIRYLTAAVDVQKYWCYWGVYGFDYVPSARPADDSSAQASGYLLAGSVENLKHTDGSNWGAHCQPGEMPPDPEAPDYWAALERIAIQLAGMFPNSSEQIGTPPMVRRMLDVGYRMDLLRPWLARNPEWTGIVGRAETQVMRELGATSGNRVTFLPGVADVRMQRDAHGDWHLWMIDVDQVKAQIHTGLTKPRGEPGCLYVPRGIEIRSKDLGVTQDGPMGWIAKHLCAEQRRRDEETGAIVWDKVDGAGRHDFLDVSTYCRAGGLAHAEWIRAQALADGAQKPTTTPPNRVPAARVERRHSRLTRRN